MSSASPLTAISPIDGRYSSKTQALQHIASEFGLVYYRLLVEIGWFKSLMENPSIPEARPLSDSAREYLEGIVSGFTINEAQKIKDIETRINHDVKAVEYYLKEKLALHRELRSMAEFVHFACTSEDINSMAYSLMLTDLRAKVLVPSIEQLISCLLGHAHEWADMAMLSRTHGQPASPTTLGKEFANVTVRVRSQLEGFQATRLYGKMNGASGNYNAHRIAYPDVDWEALARRLAEEFGLSWNRHTAQAEPHDCIAEFCDALRRINIILIDFCRDIWAYISIGYFKQKLVKSEVGSSAMPHKVNPIDFENAEGNFGIANALLDHFSSKLPISRWQRDLSDSTVLRNLGVAAAHCEIGYRSLIRGMTRLEVDSDQMLQDLDRNLQILAEPIQTVMRKYKIEGAYEKLKEFSRGEILDRDKLDSFIRSLDLPDHEKNKLLVLTPASYTGLAAMLARNA